MIQSFADVGLWPFNPDKIEENCRKFCRVVPEPNENDDLNNLARAIETCIGEELKRTSQLLSEMKCVDVVSQEKVEKRKLQEKESATSAAAENFESSTSTITTNMHTYLQPARKQGRLSKCKEHQY